jgi:hypothetical protein
MLRSIQQLFDTRRLTKTLLQREMHRLRCLALAVIARSFSDQRGQQLVYSSPSVTHLLALQAAST